MPAASSAMVPPGSGFPAFRTREFLRREVLDAVSRRSEIIHEHDFFHVQFALENSRIHGPRKIGRAHVIFDHRSGNSKARRHNAIGRQMGRRLPRKFLYDQLKLRELFAREPLLENGRELPALSPRKAQGCTSCRLHLRQGSPFPLFLVRYFAPVCLCACMLRLWIEPLSAFAFQQSIGFAGAPASRRILRNAGGLRRAPDIENRIDQRPSRLDAIAAIEQRGIAAHAVARAALRRRFARHRQILRGN